MLANRPVCWSEEHGGFWVIAGYPEVFQTMHTTPRQIISTTIDELLHYYALAAIGRLIKEEVSVGGVSMKAEQQALLMLLVANRDPPTFSYPDTLITDRSPNKHLGFGTGVHRCLGAHNHRVEAQIVIEEFLARIPKFELDRTGKAAWAPGQVADMGSVPTVFEPEEPLHNEPLNSGVQAWLEHTTDNGSKVS